MPRKYTPEPSPLFEANDAKMYTRLHLRHIDHPSGATRRVQTRYAAHPVEMVTD